MRGRGARLDDVVEVRKHRDLLGSEQGDNLGELLRRDAHDELLQHLDRPDGAGAGSFTGGPELRQDEGRELTQLVDREEPQLGAAR